MKCMLKITCEYENNLKEIFLGEGDERSLKSILEAEGIMVSAPCGGKGICGRCIAGVDGKDELCCRYYPKKDICVKVERRKNSVVRNVVKLPPEPLKEGLGLSLDLGTTTIAAFLYDLKTGECIGETGAENALSIFGADVISRIQYAENDQKLLRMTAVLREQVYDLMTELCGTGHSFKDVKYLSIAGNTVMQHIFAAMSPRSIGEAPFRPLSLFGEELIAEPTMYYCPCIAGYVGGDTTAGILSTGIYESDEKVMLIDLGTNCEFALGDRNGFICCSSPAGPAFEAGSGKGELKGSELIDEVAALLKNGTCSESGRLLSDGGKVSQKDVRNLQLAKAAVRGAIETVLMIEGIRASDVKRILIAGGFGMYLDIENAFTIGMFPEEFRGRITYVGNSAGAGASMALSQKNRKKLKDIAAMCRYEELSSSKLFYDEYIDAMSFE